MTFINSVLKSSYLLAFFINTALYVLLNISLEVFYQNMKILFSLDVFSK